MDKKKKELDDIEEQQLREGQALYEMTKTAGFKVLERWFKDLAFHSWVDPRTIENSVDAKKEWEWRELNAFHASNNAAEILEKIQQSISQSEYLGKVKSGDLVRNQSMRIK